ncbi:MAG: toll/interleukin-1 receptor domain-containing protein [Blastocatellia bacterium]
MGLYTKPDLENKLKELKQDSTLTVNESVKKIILDQENVESFDIFLSHSYFDKKYVLALKLDIESMGLSVYIDWDIDTQLERSKVTKKTAHVLRKRMKSCKSLFFAVSENSPNSKWMPWELGYFDGLGKRVAILPILDNAVNISNYSGQEYLSLYPFVTKELITNTKNTFLKIHDQEMGCHTINCWINS